MKHKRFDPGLAAWLWVSSLQYFVVQYIAGAAWQTSFKLSQNPISDLGNTSCGVYAERYVCSPLYGLMNLSFVVLGLTMIGGALLFMKHLHLKRLAKIGFICIVAAGAGTIIVGLAPENSVGWLHGFGASLPFLLGNLGMVLIGHSLKGPEWLKYYSVVSGLLGLVALAFYVNGLYLGLGNGGLERVVAYPQTIWLIVFGLNHLFGKRSAK